MYKDLKGKLIKTPMESIRLKPIGENAFNAVLVNSEIKSSENGFYSAPSNACLANL